MTSKEIYPLRTTEALSMITDADLKLNATMMLRIAELLLIFDDNHERASFDPIPILKEISEMLEQATDVFIRNDPDPLDDRHPHRTHPDSVLGNVLKIIFKNDDFMTKLVISYILSRDNVELSIQGCRLLLACVPGLDSKVVFSEPDDFVPRLYTWAGPEGVNETLQGYSMGLLAAALENTENASKFRNENAALVPFALRRLRQLQARATEEHKKYGQTDFSQFNAEQNASNEPSTSNGPIKVPSIKITPADKQKENQLEVGASSGVTDQPPPKKRRTEPYLPALLRTEKTQRVPSFHNLRNLDDSNSKWDILQPFLIGTQQVYPLSLPTYQRYILQFLAACGEYQDLLLQTFEGNALVVLLDYIDLEKSKDVRLTFDALKYLTSLLVHRKFALDFIEKGGILALLRLPKTSLASVGVVTCFYYIAYSNDVMEILCQMSDEIVDEVVQYVLWCLEHSHESGMASACMFFSQALFFKAILRRFDQFDGPRKLYNYISTLTLMQTNDDDAELTEEQTHTSTQCVRGTCTTFKSYLSAHIFTKVENYKKMFGNSLPTGMRYPEMIGDYADYKSMKPYEEALWECESIVLEMLRFNGSTFHEAENMKKLGMVKMLLAVRILSRDWLTISSGLRTDMCVNAMESLRMMLCLPAIQTELLVQHRYQHLTLDGITMLIQTSLGTFDEDPSLRMAALGCIQRCVYVEPECWRAIIQRVKNSGEHRNHHTCKKASKYEIIMNHLEHMWTEVRKTDGVMALITLINCKSPLTEADSIRKLATNTLTGLARHPEVRQILNKLPLIAQSGLQILMREPVCSDKRDIHAAFCKEAIQLLHVVTGRKIHDQHAKEFQSSEKTHRQWVIENTKVSFNQVELLQLIHDHLVKSKLDSVAAMLKTEAKLPDRPASRSASTQIMNKPLPSSGHNFTKLNDVYPTLAPRFLESEIGGISARRPSSAASLASPIANRSHSTDDEVFATPSLPRRFTNSASPFPKRLAISPARSKSRPLTPGEESCRPYMDLSNIVTDYFKNQHSACKNPVTTCPPFSLFYPHKCPERTQKTPVVKNIALRLIDQELLLPHERVVSQWSNERAIFSRFRNIKTMHDHEESYTKAAFSVDDEHLIVGLFNGELHWVNVDTGADDGHTNCHGSQITNIDPSKDGSMILTSSAYSRPLSALWRLGEAMQRVYTYREETCVRFANTTMQRIIGTCRDKAVVYDTETNHVLDSYVNGIDGLQLENNYASFSPDDKLIFNDGLLWDVRNKNASIHIFDRLNKQTMCGTFHPHGTQVIINSEVYDIRTFRCLHHVPELSRLQLSFNSTGNIMYATEAGELHRPDFPEMIYSSFRTFDTRDYSALTTVEGRRPVIDLCASHHDQKLCVIEQMRPIMSDYMIQASTQLRLFEIGRMKDVEDENEEEEEETREDHAEEEEDSDDSGEDDAEEINGGDSPERGSVFDALGRLGDESSDSDNSVDDDDSMDSFDFENALNRIIRRQAQRRRQRANSSENDGVELPDGDGEAAVNGDNEEEGDNDEEDDDDFDMEAAIDDLVDAVDEEVDEEELGSDNDSGSWRTASRIGSEDINLDDLDEEGARDAEDEGNEQPQEQPEEVEEPEEPEEPEEDPLAAAGAARRAILARSLRDLRMNMGLAMRGAANRRRFPEHHQAEILNARAEEQRAQFMEAIRGADPVDQHAAENEANDSDNDYESEEEEINSVSTTALNPALRRLNRRHQHDDGPAE